MSIKTWSQRITPESTAVAQLRAMQAEIDELRAALKTAQEAVVNNCARVLERDAEIVGWKADQKENLANQCNLQATINAQRNVLEQALEALQSLFSFEVDEHRGERCASAITAIQEQLNEHN